MSQTGFIWSAQGTLWGNRTVIGFGNSTFCVKEINRELANKIIRENHYSKTVYNGSMIHLGVFAPELLGVLQFGVAMNPASQGSVVAETKADEYLELNRMWLDDKLPRNSESRAISFAMKMIKKKYPKVQWVQSFADERCGCYGVVYQACNFVYCGEHTSVFWEFDGQMYHNSVMTMDRKRRKGAAWLQDRKADATPHKFRQFRYLYFLDRRARSRLLLKEKPYPKHGPGTAVI